MRGTLAYGLFETGAASRPFTLAGGQTSCSLISNGPDRCVITQWPFAQNAYDRARGNLIWGSWHGSLLRSTVDGTGLEYLRNRVYDSQSGRFTQEDPIGLAGGLNLYGFAGGDPANFSDPFGLCPQCLTGLASVAVGYTTARLTGQEYGLGSAAVDFAMAAATAGASLAGKAKTGIAAIRAAGLAFKREVGITAGKKAIPSLTRTAARRFPDELTATTLREAKSGRYVEMSAQLNDFLLFSKEKGLDFILDVRRGAGIGPRLQRHIDAGDIILRRNP